MNVGKKTVINIVASCEDVTEKGKILANSCFCVLLTWIYTLDDSESGSASTIGITVGVVGVVSVLFVVLILLAFLLIQRKCHRKPHYHLL